MKEFIEKLIGRLEEYKTKAYVTGFTNNPYELGACHAMDDAVKIVNQLAEEYQNDNLSQLSNKYWKCLTKFGVDITEKWETATQNAVALEQAYIRGRQDERDKFARWQDEHKDGWIPCSRELPPHSDDLLLIQCSGKPKNNIIFDNAFCLASYTEEGWILEMYPEWKDAEVIAWMPLPEPFKPKGE